MNDEQVGMEDKKMVDRLQGRQFAQPSVRLELATIISKEKKALESRAFVRFDNGVSFSLTGAKATEILPNDFFDADTTKELVEKFNKLLQDNMKSYVSFLDRALIEALEGRFSWGSPAIGKTDMETVDFWDDELNKQVHKKIFSV